MIIHSASIHKVSKYLDKITYIVIIFASNSQFLKKEENADNQHFFPLSTVFYTVSKRETVTVCNYLQFVVCKCLQSSQIQNFVIW